MVQKHRRPREQGPLRPVLLLLTGAPMPTITSATFPSSVLHLTLPTLLLSAACGSSSSAPLGVVPAGDAGPPMNNPAPGAVVTQVAVDAETVCGVLASGQVACAGSNGKGQLGDGTT